MIYDIENWLWKSELGTFWRPLWTTTVNICESQIKKLFLDKIKLLLTHVRKTPPLRSHYCEDLEIVAFLQKQNHSADWEAIAVRLNFFKVPWFFLVACHF